MRSRDLAAELDAGFQSAATALFASDDWIALTAAMDPIDIDRLRKCVRAVSRANANNAASGLADRTITSESADVANRVNTAFDIEQTVKDAIREWVRP